MQKVFRKKKNDLSSNLILFKNIASEKGNTEDNQNPVIFGLLNNPEITLSEVKGFWNHIIKPFKVSKGPYQLNQYWVIQLKSTGIVPISKEYTKIVLLVSFLRNSWKPQKHKNNGIQLIKFSQIDEIFQSEKLDIDGKIEFLIQLIIINPVDKNSG